MECSEYSPLNMMCFYDIQQSHYIQIAALLPIARTCMSNKTASKLICRLVMYSQILLQDLIFPLWCTELACDKKKIKSDLIFAVAVSYFIPHIVNSPNYTHKMCYNWYYVYVINHSAGSYY